ncbi:hypothetical protein KY290_025702 [Solanum tuberosum]|uniref:F-box domain-containing protein n=1 Tax=Solanum tuberosum TaxID=4113 RepID=A0ABQ7UUB4_SOLTU|nr:hypothetical protein KY289_025893 [Solanum tuberosum]KAH0755432.1 hypothetical protein KY290_025702 [Solanum tuberosum]
MHTLTVSLSAQGRNTDDQTPLVRLYCSWLTARLSTSRRSGDNEVTFNHWKVLFGSFFIVSACLRLNEFKPNKELVGKEYAAKMSRPLNLLVRPHVSTSARMNIVMYYTGIYSQESIMSQQNIMREILSWLPVKSLLRFKCVSKSWDITMDPFFRTKHQSCHEVNSQRFLLLRAKFDIYTQYFHDLYSTSSLSSLDDVERIDYLSSRCYPSMDILCGSCDGLVLIRVLTNREYLLLWNPSTRESIQLPFPIFGIRNSNFGLGYDPTIDDY